MTSLITNRVQSAYSRSSYRAGTDGQDSHIKKRPTTSMATHEPYSDLFDEAALRTLEPATLSAPPNRRRRPKTGSTITSTSARSTLSRKLHSDEIERLLRSLDHDNTIIVQVDCLADHPTLVQTLDLRKTPLDCQILCALQQQENRIIQHNACRDRRFRSLMETLEPKHILRDGEKIDTNDVNHNIVSEYPPSDVSYDYIK